MRKIFGFLAALLFTAGLAHAQIAVQQNATRADASTWVQGQANGATSCNTVSQTVANDTITITPPAGQYVYVNQLYVYNATNATGVTQTGTIAIGGVANAGVAANLSFASALTTTQGVPAPQIIQFNPPLKGATAGTAVTFTPSATQSANNYLCMWAAGYFAN